MQIKRSARCLVIWLERRGAEKTRGEPKRDEELPKAPKSTKEHQKAQRKTAKKSRSLLRVKNSLITVDGLGYERRAEVFEHSAPDRSAGEMNQRTKRFIGEQGLRKKCSRKLLAFLASTSLPRLVMLFV